MPRSSVESAADLTDVFDTEKFALAASYTVTGGSAAMVNGLFDERHVAVDVGGQVQVADVAPQFQCATSDVSSADMCAAITVNSVVYAVVEAHPDRTDVTTMILERVWGRAGRLSQGTDPRMLMLSPTMPITISTTEPTLSAVIGSLNQMTPMAAISAVPAPAQME